MRTRTNKQEADRLAAFYEAHCANPNCTHQESDHSVDGDCLDGACQRCGCGAFQEVTI
jgi:hypothetical protein